MIAKTIYENRGANFERGLNPKSALGIGVIPVTQLILFQGPKELSGYTEDYTREFLEGMDELKRKGQSLKKEFSAFGFRTIEDKIVLLRDLIGTKVKFEDEIYNIPLGDNFKKTGLYYDKIKGYRNIEPDESLMKTFFLKENTNFEREIDPRDAMNIGLKSRRVFKNMEDLLDWVFKFPDVISEGHIKEWDYKLWNNGEGISQIRRRRIFMIKWIKDYINMEDPSGGKPYSIGLKTAKETIDQLERNVLKKAREIGLLSESHNFERNSDVIKSTGIGRYDIDKRNFSTIEDFNDWVYNMIPEILEFKEMPKDLLISTGHIKSEYFFDIDNFLKLNNDDFKIGVAELTYRALLNALTEGKINGEHFFDNTWALYVQNRIKEESDKGLKGD